jgi:phosphoribosylaminoimidazole-succinocarboxamide synthase
MEKRAERYRGKAKTVYATDDPTRLIIEYRDDTSAFDGAKVAQLAGKGETNNRFNAAVMQRLAAEGVETHFEALLGPATSLVKALDMVPVECVVRNRLAGSLAKRLGRDEGEALRQPVFEFFYKSDALHDPFINDDHVRAFGWASNLEIEVMRTITLRVNTLLKEAFAHADILLVDFKLEFGRFEGRLLLGDEFSPDGCRLWDAKTLEKLDKDRFRRDLGGVVEAYQEVARRLGVAM